MDSKNTKPPKLFHEPAMSFDEIAQATGMTINQVRHMVNMALHEERYNGDMLTMVKKAKIVG